ncbi:hypothetical protein TEA_010035 [Camellia sinensis var. sinensis]|uniref:Protein arginine methyltransferase NDUFAF7 n=1 Tax=Camellia sinensis var. sinensis TaxID=542762 RepID=A0A4S4DFT6_CAMSN|nr:hypothetical protein TEA_010035 [Camellia sinensis var. sinensis]
MEGVVSSQYRTSLAYWRSRTPVVSGYKRSYCGCASFKAVYIHRQYVQNISRYIKKTKRGVRKLQLYDEQLRDVKFDNKCVARLLNGIELGNKRCDRQSDKIVVKGIKLIENVQLGQDAKDKAVVHHVLFFVISDNSPSDSVPTPDKIFIRVGEGNSETWIVDPDQSDRFRMLKKMRFKLVGGKDRGSVEISSSLTKKQLETVGQVQSHLSKFRVECRDAADKNGWENQVLPWMEVWVEKQHDRSELAELYKPLQDPLIISCMEILDLDKDLTTRGGRTTSTARNIWAKIFPKPRRCWLPTGCLKLLEVLHGALPKMSLIASDFSFLPDVKVPGERAPLVSTKGDADIFFPTDFWLLERIDHYCSGWLKLQKDKSSNKGKKRRTIMLDTSSFMEEFGLPSKTRTKDGYNPLLDDFKNTKIYLSVPTHNTK